jgi:hypothetical protein
MLVELHHAMLAAKENLTESGGESAAQKVEALKAEVKRLRAQYQTSVRLGVAHET